MSKKPRKIEESAAAYSPKKTGKAERAPAQTAGTQYLDEATFKKSADHVFKVHEELFRKLAK
ncbi:MAG TPA: hypothetical protein VGM64_17460 [Lacunisphaera sp.]|jgi:hypothetical protein